MRRKTIFLVEDNSEDEFLVKRAFRRNNLPVEVIVAKNGQEPLDVLLSSRSFAGRRFETPPNLVLLDLDIPIIDGFAVLRAIRGDARTRLIPVVIFTSSADEQDREKAYELGANSYVVKPAEARELQEVIRDLCRYWLALNSPLARQTKREPIVVK